MPHPTLSARVAALFLAALTTAFLSACGQQGDSTPAVSVLGILNRVSVTDRPIIPFQIEEVSAPERKSPSYTYSATGLPAGLTVGPTTGLISGTPTTENTYGVVVTVTNANGQSSSRRFTWTIVKDRFFFQRTSTGTRLEASDTTATGSTLWCFKEPANWSDWVNAAEPTAPALTDTCWSTSRVASFNRDANLPVPRYVMWRRDSKDNISSKAVRGPCTAELYAKAATLNPSASLVCMSTSFGELGIELTGPGSETSNFLQYANSGFYDGTVFHRLLTDKTNSPFFAVLQGGAFTYSNAFTQKISGLFTAFTPTNPNPLANPSGSLSFVPTFDVNSNTYPFFAQFSINLADNPCLDASTISTSGCAYSGKDPNMPALPVFGQIFYQPDATFADLVTRLKTITVTTGGFAGETSLPSPPPMINGLIRIR